MCRRPILALLPPVLVALLLSGCAGGQSGSESPIGGDPASPTSGDSAGLAGCAEISREAIDRDTLTPMGFTPRQALNLAVGTDRSMLEFTESDETGLTLTVTDTGEEVELVDVEPADDNPDAGCPDYVLIPVSVQFTTDDGRLDEGFDVKLVAFQPNETSFTQRLDAETLNGSFQYDSVDAASYEQRDLVINAVYDPDGSRGRVSGIGRREDDTQSTLVIANWGDSPAGDAR